MFFRRISGRKTGLSVESMKRRIKDMYGDNFAKQKLAAQEEETKYLHGFACNIQVLETAREHTAQ